MISFNVSADVQDEILGKFVLEMLETGVDEEQLRLHAGLSESFMASIKAALAEPIPGLEDGELPREGTGDDKGTKAKKAPAVKMVIVLAKDEEGNLSPLAFTMTHRDTILSKEVRDALTEQGMELEEVEPMWFSEGEDLPMLLDELANQGSEDN